MGRNKKSAICWDVINDLNIAEAVDLFVEYNFETLIEWREGSGRGETDYTIYMFDGGYLLGIQEPDSERYYTIKNIKF